MAQVIDDRLENEHPILEEPFPETEETPATNEEEHLNKALEDQAVKDEFPDSSQYNDKQPSYKEYDGYDMPSDDEEPIYIWTMSDEAGTTMSPALAKLNDVDWKPHHDTIQRCFQHTPWLPVDMWEFTLCGSITHTFGCDICRKYKEHQIIAEAMGDTSDSSAWKIQRTYEQDLIQLGWDLVHEHGRLQQDQSTLEIMEQRLYKAHMDAEFQRCLSDQATKQCSKLHHLNDQASETYNKLLAELEYANADSMLRDNKAKLWEDHYKALHMFHVEVEKQLAISQQIITLSTENAHMGDPTPTTGTTDQAEQNESLLNLVMGIHFRDLLLTPE
jgi:hypothetical protein